MRMVKGGEEEAGVMRNGKEGGETFFIESTWDFILVPFSCARRCLDDLARPARLGREQRAF